MQHLVLITFILGFWEDGANAQAEDVWNYVKKFVELDMLSSERKGDLGNELDQFWSAKFLGM